MWAEDAGRIANHKPATVVQPGNWVLYADVIAAQLEERDGSHGCLAKNFVKHREHPFNQLRIVEGLRVFLLLV